VRGGHCNSKQFASEDRACTAQHEFSSTARELTGYRLALRELGDTRADLLPPGSLVQI
jgi:hypothetical protein